MRNPAEMSALWQGRALREAVPGSVREMYQGNPTLPHSLADPDTEARTFVISLSPACYQNK